jgi:hypothetical protein
MIKLFTHSIRLPKKNLLQGGLDLFSSLDNIFMFITGPEVEGKYSADLFVQRARKGFMTRIKINNLQTLILVMSINKTFYIITKNCQHEVNSGLDELNPRCILELCLSITRTRISPGSPT